MEEIPEMGRTMTKKMLLCEQNVCNLGTTARMDDVLDASGLLGRAFHIFFREQHGAPPGKI
jgi:hypothetical protein